MDRKLAVHRTVVVVDVEGFGDPRRTNRHQVGVRDGLYEAVRTAFDSAGIRWDECDHEDRGDGILILARPEVPKSLFVESLIPALVAGLKRHNEVSVSREQIRLRMALHAGEVNYDNHGVTGVSINLTFRLLEASALKAALAGSSGVLAVITSSWFFEDVIRHTAEAASFLPVPVVVKETAATGWMWLSPHMNIAGRERPVALEPAVPVLAAQPASVLRALPRDVATFTGRARELEYLAAAASSDGEVISIHAVNGMAGVGKTAFAVHVACNRQIVRVLSIEDILIAALCR